MGPAHGRTNVWDSRACSAAGCGTSETANGIWVALQGWSPDAPPDVWIGCGPDQDCLHRILLELDPEARTPTGGFTQGITHAS
ncbi:MAG: hypothetical protein OXK76_14060 [Gammaproteobacteria bacterium]|nr:hypothetical protein [Gammaproteobacteria bacterium]